MTKLYLIRHAEAEGNLYRRIHGQYDSLVTDNGYRQIAALQERFEDIQIDAVYSSDLSRTMTTAKAICEPKGLELHTRPDLREISMGEWEDRTWGEVDLTDHESMQLFVHSDPSWRVQGSESFEELRNRVSSALLDIADKHAGQSVAVFSHGTAIRYSCAKLLGLSLEESRTLGHSDNTAVTLLEIENGNVTIAFRDDNSHLSEDISTLARQGWWRRKEGTSPDENLWYQPMDFSQFLYKGLYLASRQEAWMDLGRDLRYLERQNYLEKAETSYKKGPQFLMSANRKHTIVGMLQLDPDLGKEDNAGYISFFYMIPEYRGKGLGVQLFGQAISTYRPMGRTKLRLACGEDNAAAKHFYAKHGFQKIGEKIEPYGTIHLLEKNIGY